MKGRAAASPHRAGVARGAGAGAACLRGAPALQACRRGRSLALLAGLLLALRCALVPAQSPAEPAPTPAAPEQTTPGPEHTTPAPEQTTPGPAPTLGPAPTPAPEQTAPAPGSGSAPEQLPPAPPPVSTAAADFTVSDIKIEGLQRVSEGTVYNYLPVNIGDHLTPQRVREAIRALYATGFFRDVQLRREGNTLIVVVLERPSIESFEITGNKDIKTEDLQKSLRGVGLATGKTFDRSVLEDVTQYLTDQYFARGKYGVRITSTVEEEAGNRVKIKIDIKEGSRAKIRQINIVGATKFPQKAILETLEL
ncbi:MAG: hypothetical protein JO158_04275, partial [Gammaproteobacteria bacterium]|nr:hypothetical protein [Gammaproteobacteria bacterium]